ncbi:MAG TPA: FAD-dependent oxidoreductase [Aggregatilineales bacterium]|nr:FAD-dependent oxidoreductase [Aggregatilineales bacterium]
MTRRWIQSGALAGGGAALLSLGLFIIVSGSDTNRLVPGLLMYLGLAVASGAGYGWLLRAHTDRYPFAVMGVLYGLLSWVFFGLVLVPVFAGLGPRWNAVDAAGQFPLLMVYLLQGALLALALRVLEATGLLRLMATTRDTAEHPTVTRRVVILGGGFAGVTTAQELEKLLGETGDVEITLVSRTNHLLFTPMLAEVTAGGVEAQHISPPLRAFFRRVQVMRGEPAEIRIAENRVLVQSGSQNITDLTYDYLVLALGAVPNFFGNTALEQYAFTFKSLADAIHIRNHVIDCLERADSEPDPMNRRTMLTFVVVGAGFAGTELIGGLNDFVRGSLWYYKHLHNDDVTFLLVHPGEHILPELSTELARYAEKKMTDRGVTIRGNSRVTDAALGRVSIGDEAISSETLIWTAGNLPNPLLKQIGCEMDNRGAVITDERLLVRGQHNIWAVGDCASIPDVVTGKKAPPTAQYALREAKTLAYNLCAVLNGREPKVFSHRSQGALAVVGHQTACAEVFGFKFSGLFAWLLWRGIYLSKLPTLEKKIRVLLDWVIDVFFPRDITYAPLIEERTEAAPAAGD